MATTKKKNTRKKNVNEQDEKKTNTKKTPQPKSENEQSIEQPLESESSLMQQDDSTKIAEEEARVAEERRLAEEARIAEEAEKRAEEIHNTIRQIATKEAAESLMAELATLKNSQNSTSNCCCDAKKKIPTAIKAAIICFAIIATIVINASFENNKSYYMCDTSKGLEIWQGDFAPMSKKRIAILEGLNIPDIIKSSYNKNEVFPIPFNYYLDKADNLIKSGSPFNFYMINDCIDRASEFISKPEDKDIIEQYVQNIKAAQGIIQTAIITIPARKIENEKEISIEEQKSDLLDHSDLLNNMDSNKAKKIDGVANEAPKTEKAEAVADEAPKTEKAEAVADEAPKGEKSDDSVEKEKNK